MKVKAKGCKVLHLLAMHLSRNQCSCYNHIFLQFSEGIQIYTSTALSISNGSHQSQKKSRLALFLFTKHICFLATFFQSTWCVHKNLSVHNQSHGYSGSSADIILEEKIQMEIINNKSQKEQLSIAFQ